MEGGTSVLPFFFPGSYGARRWVEQTQLSLDRAIGGHNDLTEIAVKTLLDGTVTIVDLLGLAVIVEGVLIGALLLLVVFLVRKVFQIVGALTPQIAVQRQLLEQIEEQLIRTLGR